MHSLEAKSVAVTIAARNHSIEAYLIVYVRANCLDGRSVDVDGGVPLNLLLVGHVVLRCCLNACQDRR